MIAGFASPPVSSHPGLLHHVSASFSNMNTFSSPLVRTSHVHYCIWFWLPRSVCSLSNILCPVIYWRLLYILANCTFRLLHKSRYPSYHNPIVILKIARHLFLQSCSISCARRRLLDLILSVMWVFQSLLCHQVRAEFHDRTRSIRAPTVASSQLDLPTTRYFCKIMHYYYYYYLKLWSMLSVENVNCWLCICVR